MKTNQCTLLLIFLSVILGNKTEAKTDLMDQINSIHNKVDGNLTLFCNNCLRPEASEEDCIGFEEQVKQLSCDGNGGMINPFSLMSNRNPENGQLSANCRHYLFKKASEQALEMLESQALGESERKVLYMAPILYYISRTNSLSMEARVFGNCGSSPEALEIASQVSAIIEGSILIDISSKLDTLQETAELEVKARKLRGKAENLPAGAKRNRLLLQEQKLMGKIAILSRSDENSILEEEYCNAVGNCRLLGGEMKSINIQGHEVGPLCLKGGLFIDDSCLKLKGKNLRNFSRGLSGLKQRASSCLQDIGGAALDGRTRFQQHLETPLESDQGPWPRTQICCGDNGCDGQAITDIDTETLDNFRLGTIHGLATAGSSVGTVYLSHQTIQSPQRSLQSWMFHEFLHRIGVPCHPLHNHPDQNLSEPNEQGQCYPQSIPVANRGEEKVLRWINDDGKCIPDPTLSIEMQNCANHIAKTKVRDFDPVYACQNACFGFDNDSDTSINERNRTVCRTFISNISESPGSNPLELIGLNRDGESVNLCQMVAEGS